MKRLTEILLCVWILSACAPVTTASKSEASAEYPDFAYLMRWSPDDTLLAATTATGLYVYDTGTYEQRAAFPGFSGSTVVFGKEIMAAINNNGLYVWGLDGYKLLFKEKTEEPATFSSLAVSPDGVLLATGERGRFRVWSLPDGRVLSDIPVEGVAATVAFESPDRLVVITQFDAVVQEWDLTNNKMLRSFEIPSDVIRFVLSGDGKIVLIDYGDSGFELWDVPAGKLNHVYDNIISAPGWERLSGDNRYLAAWGYTLDGGQSGLSVWDLEDHVRLREFQTPMVRGDGWRCGELNSDGSTLAASDNQSSIYFYDVASGAKVGEIFLPYTFVP